VTEPLSRPYFAAKARLADLSQTSRRTDPVRRRKAGGSAKDELNDENDCEGPDGRRRDGVSALILPAPAEAAIPLRTNADKQGVRRFFRLVRESSCARADMNAED